VCCSGLMIPDLLLIFSFFSSNNPKYTNHNNNSLVEKKNDNNDNNINILVDLPTCIDLIQSATVELLQHQYKRHRSV
jgi:hypothetical protein